MSRRVFVCVSGGVVDEVIVPPQTDGTPSLQTNFCLGNIWQQLPFGAAGNAFVR